MRLVGFNFHKIKAEKNKEITSETKANTKINLIEVSSLENPLTKTKEILRIDFSYIIEYTSNVGIVDLEGYILLTTDEDQIKAILDSWKSKKLIPAVKTAIFNIILRKANVKALELEEELNLPLHIPMPKVQAKEKE
jgi:hypothetical protein